VHTCSVIYATSTIWGFSPSVHLNAMDAYMADALRHHIREKLLDYAPTHLTVDYISFSENAVVDTSLSSVPFAPTQKLTWPIASYSRKAS
jgi:hypothetical protein